MVLPNFLVIGAQASGTTWLDSQLRGHPQVYLPTVRKEVQFFSRYFDKGIDWYEQFFPSKSESEKYLAIGEVTPGYLYKPKAAERIFQHLPTCKLIVVLRNPVDRAYSQYKKVTLNQKIQSSFLDSLEEIPEIFMRGLYGQQLQRYLNFFNLKNLEVLIFEKDIVENPQNALNKIAKFLNINKELFISDQVFNKINKSYSVEFGSLYSFAYRLSKFFRDNDLDWIVNFAKKNNIKKVFGAKKEFPTLDLATKNKVFERYLDDLELLESILGGTVDIWRL